MVQVQTRSQRSINLKQHCDVDYQIKGSNLKIGKLSDYQLDVSKGRLMKKLSRSSLSFEETMQLQAIDYVIGYRSQRAVDKLSTDISSARLSRASVKADIITGWITRSYKG